MSIYLRPKQSPLGTISETFNVSDYNYQTEKINFGDAMTLTTNQVINSQKEFIKNVVISNESSLTVNGTTYLFKKSRFI